MLQGQFEQMGKYVKKVQFQTDYSAVLGNLIALNPEGAVDFAKSLLDCENEQPLIEVKQVVKVFTEKGAMDILAASGVSNIQERCNNSHK